MKHFYYAFALLAILWEMYNMAHPKKMQEIYKRNEGVEWDHKSDSDKVLGFLGLGYFLWVFVGLLSFQWPAFLAFIVLSNTIGRLPRIHYSFRVIDALLSLALLIFIILNTYHLKIDLWQWITNNI